MGLKMTIKECKEQLNKTKSPMFKKAIERRKEEEK